MVEVYNRGGSIEACMLWPFFNDIIEYDTLIVEPARFRKKMFLEFELLTNTVPINLDADNSERANVVDNVWTEGKTTWKHNVCVPYVDNFTGVNG